MAKVGDRSRRSQGRALAHVAAAAGVAALLGSAVCSFVPAPAATSSSEHAAGSSVLAMGGLIALPLAANAELPPLEDLPLEDLQGQMTNYSKMNDNFYGIPFPAAVGGVLFAMCWAAFVVNNIVPKKEEEGVYKTYIGAGNLPPEGFTNPLDPRIEEDETTQNDPIYQKQKKVDREKSAGSAIV